MGLLQGEELQRELFACTAVINTSVHEGFPVSFLEAFASARPVISMQNPDDVVTRFGFAVPHADGMGLDQKSLQAYADAIRACMRDAEQAGEKGRGGREYVEQRHSFGAFEQELTGIFELFTKERNR